MANKSGTIYGTHASNGNYLYIVWEETSYSIANNTSTVKATVYLYNGYGSHSDGDPTWVTLYIDGTKYTATLYNWSGTPVTLLTQSKTVSHASDGTKSCSISASFDTNGTSTGTVSASGTAVLTTIPRYATSNQSVAEKTDTEIKMNWSSDSTCDYVWYSIDNGSHWTAVGSVNAKSGSYKITGLSPKTAYNIKTRVRRKDSQLTTDSAKLTVTTYGANYFTLALEDMTESGSLTQIMLKATTRNTEENNTSKIYSVQWEYYPSGNQALKETINANNCLPDNGSVNQSFTKLLTGTAYIITAKLYKGTVSSGTLMRTQSIAVTTAPLEGTFKLTARSSSVLHVALEGLPKLEYNTRIDVSYKRHDDSSWTPKDSVNIASGSDIKADVLVSGLTQMTAYDFRAQVYKVDGTKAIAMKTYEFSTSTLAYVEGLEDLLPYIKSSVAVPMAGKGYIVVGLSGTLPEGFSVHIYSSEDNTDYTDLGAVANDMNEQISTTVGTELYYKLALVDRNDNAYNETEPTQISFPDLIWRTRITGDPFDVTASEMRSFANALISLYQYLDIENSVSDSYTELYDELVTKMGTLNAGSIVEGGEDSGYILIDSLACAIAGLDPAEPKAAGEPIQASYFNAMCDAIEDAIRTIMD